MIKFSFPALPAFLASTFGLKPKLKSPTDLATAVAVIASIDARSQAVEAHCQAAIDEINQSGARELQIVIGEEKIPADLYRNSLVAAIEDYLPKAKDAVFTGETQTVRFPCGEVSYKSRPEKVELDRGVKATKIADALVKRKKLLDLIHEVLAKTNLAGWIRIKCELDLASIQKRFKEGKVKKKDLPQGLSVSPEGEVYSVKPFATPDRSEISAA